MSGCFKFSEGHFQGRHTMKWKCQALTRSVWSVGAEAWMGGCQWGAAGRASHTSHLCNSSFSTIRLYLTTAPHIGRWKEAVGHGAKKKRLSLLPQVLLQGTMFWAYKILHWSTSFWRSAYASFIIKMWMSFGTIFLKSFKEFKECQAMKKL